MDDDDIDWNNVFRCDDADDDDENSGKVMMITILINESINQSINQITSIDSWWW